MIGKKEINEELKSKFSNLKFNEKKHEYYVDGRSLTPVTNVAKKFSVEFDVEYHSRRIAERDGLTQDEVKKQWKEIGDNAADLGTNVHNFGERYVQAVYFGEAISVVPENNKENAIIKYWKSLPMFLYPVSTELRMYSEKYGYAGTCDVLLFNSLTGKFIIDDYKTNEKLFDDYNQTMHPPFDYLPNNNFNIYQLQLSLYRIMLEDMGYGIENTRIVWLKSDGSFEILQTNDFSKMLREVL